MTIFLIVALVIAIGALIQQYRVRRRIVKTSSRLISNQLSDYRRLKEKYDELETNYAHLEEGQQELIDNYENDFLSFQEKIETAKNSAEYDREKREEAERLLALKDKIIEKHAGSCETILAEVVNEMVAELRPADE